MSMKAIHVAIRDLRLTLRSGFSLAMMFAAPLLITGLLYFAFGGLSGDGEEIDIARNTVAIADEDDAAESAMLDAGEILKETLRSETAAAFFDLVDVENKESALDMVRERVAEIALIIPAGFSRAVIAPGATANVQIIHDPAVTIGHDILKDFVRSTLDLFNGSKIAGVISVTQSSDERRIPDFQRAQRAASEYTSWARERFEMGTSSVIVRSPRTDDAKSENPSAVIGLTMAAMMIFFLFFIAANNSASIIREQEEGTLSRLFTTPTRPVTLFGGKLLGVFVVLVIQAIVLYISSWILFGIDWRPIGALIIGTFGMLLAAAGFGIFIMSLVKSTQQEGPVMGGVLTLTGMLSGLFFTGIPNLPDTFETVGLFLPQGWALEIMRQLFETGTVEAVVIPTIVLSAMGIGFLSVGTFLFGKRFT